MARTFYLRLLLTGQEDLVFEVREAEGARLEDRLAKGSDDDPKGFFWFDSIDGRSIIVNLAFLQGVRYLWDVSVAPPDSRMSANHRVIIAMHGRKPISENPSEPEDLYTLFWELELEVAPVVTFTDSDGESFSLVASQVVYISASKDDIDEGRRLVEVEDGLEEQP